MGPAEGGRLGRLAEVALAADLDAGTAGDRYQVVLHVEARRRRRGRRGPVRRRVGGRRCGGPRFRGNVATTGLRCWPRAMHHDADGHVLDVGRKTRTIPPAIRRALSARDTRCRFPGCSARRCDAHHIDHWVDGGATSLDNLVLLCRRHHRLVHEGGFTLERPDRMSHSATRAARSYGCPAAPLPRHRPSSRADFGTTGGARHHHRIADAAQHVGGRASISATSLKSVLSSTSAVKSR